MNSSLGNDIGVETVAEIDRVDIITILVPLAKNYLTDHTHAMFLST